MPAEPGWKGDKYMLKSDSGRALQVGRKKIDVLRQKLGLPWSNDYLAKEYMARKQTKPKAPAAPRAPKANGWTPQGGTFKTDGKRVARAKIEKLRGAPGYLPFSNNQLARAVLEFRRTGTKPPKPPKKPAAAPTGYSTAKNAYSYVDEKGTRRSVKGEDVRKAIAGGDTRPALDIAKAIVKRRLNMRGVDEKREAYVTTLNKTIPRKTFPLPVIRSIQNTYGLNKLNDAARKYMSMDSNKPAKGESGIGSNLANLDKKYYLWTGQRHEKIPMDELARYRTPGISDEVAAQRAYKDRKVGWNPDKTAYFVLASTADNSGERRLLRIDKQVMERVKGRLEALGRPAHNTDAALAWLRSKAYKKELPNDRPGVGWYDYHANAFVAPAGNKVPGATFMKNYAASARPNNNNNAVSGIRTSAVGTIVAKHVKSLMIDAVEADRASRERLDEAWIKKMPAPTSPAFQKYLATLFQFSGPLANRPMLTGNVGVAGVDRSALEQIMDITDPEKRVDGCKFKQFKDGRGGSLQVHQSVVFAMANLRARDAIKTPGLLAVHSTGAGKSMEGLSVMLAFWNKTFRDPRTRETRPYGNYPMAVSSNQSSNDLGKLAQLAVDFFPWFKSTFGNEYPFASGVTAARAALAARLRAGHRAMLKDPREEISDSHLMGTYGKLAHDFYGFGRGAPKIAMQGNKFRHCVFVCDEIQLLFSPPSSEATFVKREYPEIRRLLQHDRDPATTWVFAMTATPGESQSQVAEVMECVAGAKGGFSTPELLRRNAAGLVSYAYVMGDTSKFAKVDVVHECIDIDKSTALQSGGFASRYADSLMKLAETRNIPGLQNDWIEPTEGPKGRVSAAPSEAYTNYDPEKKQRYWSRVRSKGEWLRLSAADQDYDFVDENNDNNNNKKKPSKANAYANISTLEQEGNNKNLPIVRARQGGRTRDSRLRAAGPVPKVVEMYYVLSPKLVQIIAHVVNPAQKGTHYVYSPDMNSLRLIAWILQTRFGYAQFAAKNAKDPPAKRYAFIDTSTQAAKQMWNPNTSRFEDQPPGVKASDIDALKSVLSNKSNIEGECVRVVLATRESFKGVDIPGWRHIHIPGAMVDYVDLLQLIGRGPRMCGHKSLRMNQRKVTVHMYKLTRHGGCLSGEDRKLLPDCHVMDLALERFKSGWQRVEKVLMHASIDYEMFKSNYSAASTELHEAIAKPCTVFVDPKLSDAIKMVKPKIPRKPKKLADPHKETRVKRRLERLNKEAAKGTENAAKTAKALRAKVDPHGATRVARRLARLNAEAAKGTAGAANAASALRRK